MAIIYGTISVQLENRFAENAIQCLNNLPYAIPRIYTAFRYVLYSRDTKETITSYKLNACIIR